MLQKCDIRRIKKWGKQWKLLTVPVSLWSSQFEICGTLPIADSCWEALGSSPTPVDQVKSTWVFAGTRAEKAPGNRLRCSGKRLYRSLNMHPLRSEHKSVPSRCGCWSNSCREQPVRKTSPSALRIRRRHFGGGQGETTKMNCPVRYESSPDNKTSCLECPF